MIEWLVQKLFWWDPLRKAIFDEVHLYDHIDTLMENGTDIASSSWMGMVGHITKTKSGTTLMILAINPWSDYGKINGLEKQKMIQ